MSEPKKLQRLLPQSKGAEEGLLGSILLSPQEVMPKCIDNRITEEHFYAPAHGIIYGVLQEFYDANKPIDLILVTQALRDRDVLGRVGGAAFVSKLFEAIPTAGNADYYIEILREKRTRRQAIVVCNEFSAEGYNEEGSADDYLDRLEARISTIGQDRLGTEAFNLKEEVLMAIDGIQQLYERRGRVSGLETGFPDLDRLIDGLHPAEMVVIAARPSMGKTALGMNIAEHVAVDQGKAVAVFSLEMSKQQLIQRMIASRSRVNMQSVRDGLMTDQGFTNITRVAKEISSSGIIIDDTSGLTILELRARMRKMKREKNIQLAVIDYLQLLRGSSSRAQNHRELEVSEISSGVKGLAKELEIPIIVLAQLNRNPEGRKGGMPRLSDLRESGSIEQDADVVGLLFRGEYYADGDAKEELSGVADLMIAKQRNGALGTVPLTFIKQFARFESRAEDAA